MDGDRPQGQMPVGDGAESGPTESAGERPGIGKAQDGVPQVVVRLPARSSETGEAGHREPEPGPVPESHHAPLRPGELQNYEFGSGGKDPANLGEPPLQIREIPDSEADDRGVEDVVGEGQPHRVSGYPGERHPAASGLGVRDFQHRRGQIAAHGPHTARQQEGEIPGAAAQIQDSGTRRTVQFAERRPPPALVESDAEDPVHPVVARRDGLEHAPNRPRSLPPGIRGELRRAHDAV